MGAESSIFSEDHAFISGNPFLFFPADIADGRRKYIKKDQRRSARSAGTHFCFFPQISQMGAESISEKGSAKISVICGSKKIIHDIRKIYNPDAHDRK
jgi:hypothetical protein